MRGGWVIVLSPAFERDFRKLDSVLRDCTAAALVDLQADPIPLSRRAHSVSPKGAKPTVYTIDVTSNKSHKLSFHLNGQAAVIRRVGTHKEIDRQA